MANPLRMLEKQIKANKIYPSTISQAFWKKKTKPKKIALILNTFFNRKTLTPEQINKVLLEVKKQHKRIEDSSVGLKQKQYYAITSLVSNTIANAIAKENKGLQAKWLPSSSANPSLAHIENYGEIFDLAEGINGELPAERPNCQCGIEIIK